MERIMQNEEREIEIGTGEWFLRENSNLDFEFCLEIYFFLEKGLWFFKEDDDHFIWSGFCLKLFICL